MSAAQPRGKDEGQQDESRKTGTIAPDIERTAEGEDQRQAKRRFHALGRIGPQEIQADETERQPGHEDERGQAGPQQPDEADERKRPRST